MRLHGHVHFQISPFLLWSQLLLRFQFLQQFGKELDELVGLPEIKTLIFNFRSAYASCVRLSICVWIVRVGTLPQLLMRLRVNTE